MFTIFTFLIVLSVLVLVHELGHFWLAKRFGVWVEEFGFGLPPRIFAKKRHETEYSLNLLPFGGFVRLHGENDSQSVLKPDKAFIYKNKRIRFSIVVAGVLMNFLLAAILFSLVYSISGIPRESGKVTVVDVMPDSPAQKSGIEVDDIVISLDGIQISKTSDFISLLAEKKGKEVEIVLKKKDGKTVKVNSTPRENPPQGEGALGVVVSSMETYYPPLFLRPFLGVYHGVRESFFWAGMVFNSLLKTVSDIFSGNVPKDIAGPVGIYVLTAQAANFGFLSLVNFVGILSINLAILNILPLPALDGGRIFFIVLEALVGRRIVPKIEAVIHTIGLIILVTLILLITAYDLKRLIPGGVEGYIYSVFK